MRADQNENPTKTQGILRRIDIFADYVLPGAK